MKTNDRVFNPKKLEKLNNPERIKNFPVNEIIEQHGIKVPDTIIDLGAGTAFFSRHFADLFPESTIYACDISPIMLKWIREKVIPSYPGIIPIQMEDSSIPLKNEIADLLFMVNLHHELPDPEKTLKECYRLLKKGGQLVISDWKKEEMDRGPSLNYRYQSSEVCAQLEKSGFRAIKTEEKYRDNFLVVAERIR